MRLRALTHDFTGGWLPRRDTGPLHLKGEHMTKTEFAAEAESIARDYANVTLLRDRDGAPLTNGDRECRQRDTTA